jgi:hypothetical protein
VKSFGSESISGPGVVLFDPMLLSGAEKQAKSSPCSARSMRMSVEKNAGGHREAHDVAHVRPCYLRALVLRRCSEIRTLFTALMSKRLGS